MDFEYPAFRMDQFSWYILTKDKWPDDCSCCKLATYVGNLCAGFGGSIDCDRCGHTKGRHGLDIIRMFAPKERDNS